MAEPAAAADRAAGKHGAVRVRRAMIIMASASGTLVSAIARLVAASGDTARDVIDAFNQKGLAALGPRWAGGRPRLISDGDIEMIVAAGQDPAGEAGACRSRTGACAGLAGYLAAGTGRCGSAGSGCGRSCVPAESASSGPGPGGAR
jgi:Winged helix-turn helix